MNRTRILRWFRISISAVCLLVCVLLIGLWVRSYWFADRFGITTRLSVSTCRGELVVTVVEPNSAFFFSLGKGYSRDEINEVFDHWDYRRAATRTWDLFAARGEELAGLRFIAIEFSALLAALVIAATVAVPWIRWRFSLRTLLIAVTLLSILLGMVVYLFG